MCQFRVSCCPWSPQHICSFPTRCPRPLHQIRTVPRSVSLCSNNKTLLRETCRPCSGRSNIRYFRRSREPVHFYDHYENHHSIHFHRSIPLGNLVSEQSLMFLRGIKLIWYGNDLLYSWRAEEKPIYFHVREAKHSIWLLPFWCNISFTLPFLFYYLHPIFWYVLCCFYQEGSSWLIFSLTIAAWHNRCRFGLTYYWS